MDACDNATKPPTPEWLQDLHLDTPEARARDARHRAEPHVSSAVHCRRRQLAIGAEALTKHRIYLDLKYWIYCRDAYEGRPQKPAHLEIWQLLSELAQKRIIVCPASDVIFIETRRQGNTDTRRTTARVVDILSQRVAMQPGDVLLRTEIAHFLQFNTSGTDSVYPLAQLAWTFVGWLMGCPTLSVPAFDAETLNWAQKCMFDAVADASFSTLIDALGVRGIGAWTEYDKLYSTLNVESQKHKHEVDSFDTANLSEVAGVLDTMKPFMAHLLCSDFQKKGGQSVPHPDAPEVCEAVREFSKLIYHAFRLKRIERELPGVRIGAGLHAALRHRGQLYHKGDLWDFHHAHPALAYCNAFFTERSLGNLICNRPLNFDKLYGCRVFWNEDAVIAHLREFKDQNSRGPGPVSGRDCGLRDA